MEPLRKFDRSKVKTLHIELSSVCNAACPMCRREVNPNFDKKNHLTSLTLNQIKEKLSPEFIKQLEFIYFCGSYGEPAAAPECVDIMRYIREVNPTIRLGMHTNGSLRSTKFWAEVGSILSLPHDYCRFGIDGLEDTNHIHRVGTVWDLIMKNSKAFIDAGGNAEWEYLVFEHNEHQVDDAEKLSKELGFKLFIQKVSRRFKIYPHIKLYPPKGERFRDQM